MNDILSELYTERYSILQSRMYCDPAYKGEERKCLRLEKEMMATFSKEQKKIYEEYMSANADLLDTQCRISFEEGFRLGACLIMTVFSPLSGGGRPAGGRAPREDSF